MIIIFVVATFVVAASTTFVAAVPAVVVVCWLKKKIRYLSACRAFYLDALVVESISRQKEWPVITLWKSICLPSTTSYYSSSYTPHKVIYPENYFASLSYRCLLPQFCIGAKYKYVCR